MDPALFIKPEINSGTTSHFLRDIWHQSECRSQKAMVYSDYTWQNRRHIINFVNDFIHHQSFLSSQLSSDQIQGIHEENAQHATLKNGGTSQMRHSQASENQDSSTQWTPDCLITDSLLDKFQILPGKREKRLNDFYTQSRILFHYLTYQLGNEKIVKARRKILRKKFSNVFTIYSNSTKFIVRGSRSEGLKMQGSDTDMLVEVESAYEDGEEKRDGIYLKYDCISGSLGYVTVKNVWGVTLTSDMFKKTYSGLLSLARHIHSSSIHGPSLSMSTWGDDFDVVPCIKSVNWPYIAQEWVYRERKYGWPSQEMINCAVKQGCHIVPVGNKKIHIDEVEWRLSFSTSEEILVFSFNHTQLLIYGFLKIILKESLNQNLITSDIICSYFLKTVLFWTIEETHLGLWSPRNTILCFNLCLDRLIQFIIEENCPNYFVPVNNMFEKRFTSPESKRKLLEELFEISANGVKWKCESMLELQDYMKDPYKVFDLKMKCSKKYAMEMWEMVLDLARFGKFLPSVYTLQGCRQESFLPFFKSLCGNPIIHDYFAPQICHFLDIFKSKRGHKKTYIFHQIFLRLLLKGCKEDLMAGKAALASWLYKQGKYENCIQVIDQALERLNLRLVHVGLKSVQYFRPNNNMVDFSKISSIKILNDWKSFTTFYMPLPLDSVIIPDEIAWYVSSFKPVFNEMRLINPITLAFPPDMYCHFLKCLSYSRLGKTVQFREEYAKMNEVKNAGSAGENFVNTILGYLLRMFLEMERVKCPGNSNYTMTPFDIDCEDLIPIVHEMSTNVRSMINLFSNNREWIGINMETLSKCFAGMQSLIPSVLDKNLSEDMD